MKHRDMCASFWGAACDCGKDSFTPRTDAVVKAMIAAGELVPSKLAAHAEALETELVDAQQRIREWRDLCEKYDSAVLANAVREVRRYYEGWHPNAMFEAHKILDKLNAIPMPTSERSSD